MGRRARVKGSTFERLVAAHIKDAAVEHLGEPYEKERAWRTPMSGGHKHEGEGDIQMSKRLMKSFPFSIECKHWKSWNPGHLFKLTKQMRLFLKQAEDGANKILVRYNKTVLPLLVIRGNGTYIFAVFPVSLTEQMTLRPPLLRMRKRWIAVILDDFLRSWFSHVAVREGI